MQEIIDKLVCDFQNTIPKEETQLLQAYKDFLLVSVENFKKSKYEWVDKKEESIERMLVSLGELYSNMSLDSKKQELLKDDKLEEIIRISEEAYKSAINKFEGKEVNNSFDVNERIQLLEQFYQSVEEYNKNRAQRYVSEGILDLEYLSNSKTNEFSLRLGERIRAKSKVLNKKEKIEEKRQPLSTNRFSLPIGSVVMLKEGTKRVMITGFCVTKENENKKWDYSGCLYPEGMISSQAVIFNHDQIKNIYYYGYVDDEEKNFKEMLKEYIKEESKRNEIKGE